MSYKIQEMFQLILAGEQYVWWILCETLCETFSKILVWKLNWQKHAIALNVSYCLDADSIYIYIYIDEGLLLFS